MDQRLAIKGLWTEYSAYSSLERKGVLVFEMFLTTVLYAGHELISFLSQPPKHTVSFK